ncbi:hypothetical protein PM082_014465 [Marasmius tenuissimus]|nr:hypothetical protein PM082_014465 [Marasmius tenuissimus]
MDAIPTIEENATFISDWAYYTFLDLVKVLAGAIFYGTYLVLLLAALNAVGLREGQRAVKTILIAALLVMFAMSSFEFWGIVYLSLRNIQVVLVNNIDMTYRAKQMAFKEEFSRLDSVLQVMLPFEIVVGSAIVLWRAWRLCAENRRLVFAPIILLFATMGCSLAFLGCNARNDWPANTSDTCNRLQISAFSLSMVTNLTGALIIYKVWAYRQAIGEFLGQCRQRTRVLKVVVLLLESGVIYSMLWIIQLVDVTLPSPDTCGGQVVQRIFTTGSTQMVGIYPALLIVLVYQNYSMWDSTGTFSTNANIPTNNLVPVYDASGGSKSTLGSTKMA